MADRGVGVGDRQSREDCRGLEEQNPDGYVALNPQNMPAGSGIVGTQGA